MAATGFRLPVLGSSAKRFPHWERDPALAALELTDPGPEELKRVVRLSKADSA
jgi:hypothetical protein